MFIVGLVSLAGTNNENALTTELLSKGITGLSLSGKVKNLGPTSQQTFFFHFSEI